MSEIRLGSRRVPAAESDSPRLERAGRRVERVLRSGRADDLVQHRESHLRSAPRAVLVTFVARTARDGLKPSVLAALLNGSGRECSERRQRVDQGFGSTHLFAGHLSTSRSEVRRTRADHAAQTPGSGVARWAGPSALPQPRAAAEAGAAILRQGATRSTPAAAAGFMEAVVSPANSGIGGYAATAGSASSRRRETLVATRRQRRRPRRGDAQDVPGGTGTRPERLQDARRTSQVGLPLCGGPRCAGGIVDDARELGPARP